MNKSIRLDNQEALHTEKLPIWNLIALSVASFLAIMTETIPAGLLPQISQGLDISEALAGQFVTLFAIGSVVAAIPLVALTQRWYRKKVLLMALCILFFANTLTALSPYYVLTLVLRFIAGMATGLLWGLVAGYARRMVAPPLQGRALAIAGTGQPIALSLGVPIGTWLGMYLDWQAIFLIISGGTLLLMIWIYTKVPDYPGQTTGQRQSIYEILRLPGVRPILCVVLVWILGHNILYTYIAPYMTHVGLANHVGFALFTFGITSIVGIWIIGIYIDHHLRLMTIISLGAFAISSLVLGIANGMTLLIFLSIAAWGLTFGGAPTLLQTAMADATGEGADVAQSIFVTIFNLSVAGGGFVGGLMLNQMGAGSFPWILLLLSLIGLLIVYRRKEQAFKPSRQ
ncbi:MFS transporter [Lysinibacillus xylanilyticus]|uniref:MFS transporter n=1 Tax=Lysinibacillus xylanilyticus TaxID=582475 RepID=A0ABT4EJ81_9BACI|nr:MFS transporter [Lysinibacillus xylanilyticus]MCY9545694.1 MFS transporter [Lysinibacillus xylanilyticus]MED3800832.1 MFS transporter [Lysinibacillus xylanilyticus]